MSEIKPRLMYLVPPRVSRSSEYNLQSLIEGLLKDATSEEFGSGIFGRSKLVIEVALLGSGHDQLAKWLSKRGIASHRIPARSATDPGALLRIRRFLIREDPELLHVWQGGIHMRIWVAALLGAERVIVDQQMPDCVLPGRSKPMMAMVKPLAKRRLAEQSCAVVQRFAAADLMAADDRALNEMSVPSTHRVIPPGVRVRDREELIAMIEADERDPASVRASLGLSPDAELIGMSNGFVRGGGGKDAIWAADLLNCVRDDAHVLFFGDGPLRWRLERFRWQTQTEGHVHFVDESRFEELLPHLRCFWQPAHTAIGVQSLLAATAAGIPVVASDLPPHRQIVQDMETGLLVTPGNRGSLARKTDLLLRDEKLRWRLGRAAREFTGKHFAISHQVDNYAKLYSEVLS